MLEAAGSFGEGARIPVTWLVAENDSYFPPAFSQRMADAFRNAGGKVNFRVLPPFGDEGHWLAESKEEGLLSSLLANVPGLNVQTPAEQDRSIAKSDDDVRYAPNESLITSFAARTPLS